MIALLSCHTRTLSQLLVWVPQPSQSTMTNDWSIFTQNSKTKRRRKKKKKIVRNFILRKHFSRISISKPCQRFASPNSQAPTSSSSHLHRFLRSLPELSLWTLLFRESSAGLRESSEHWVTRSRRRWRSSRRRTTSGWRSCRRRRSLCTLTAFRASRRGWGV